MRILIGKKMNPETLVAIINQLLPVMDKVRIDFIEDTPEPKPLSPERMTDVNNQFNPSAICGL